MLTARSVARLGATRRTKPITPQMVREEISRWKEVKGQKGRPQDAPANDVAVVTRASDTGPAVPLHSVVEAAHDVMAARAAGAQNGAPAAAVGIAPAAHPAPPPPAALGASSAVGSMAAAGAVVAAVAAAAIPGPAAAAAVAMAAIVAGDASLQGPAGFLAPITKRQSSLNSASGVQQPASSAAQAGGAAEAFDIAL